MRRGAPCPFGADRSQVNGIALGCTTQPIEESYLVNGLSARTVCLVGIVLVGCRAARSTPPASAADSAMAAGFQSLITAIARTPPGLALFCLDMENPAFQQDPSSGVRQHLDPPPAVLNLLSEASHPVYPTSWCADSMNRRRSSEGAWIAIDHLLPLSPDSVLVSADASRGRLGFSYQCYVTRAGGRWYPGPCRQTGIID